MRRRFLIGAAGLMSAALGAVMVFPPQEHWIWNRTDSAPKGLYRLSNGPLALDRWAIVSAEAPASQWITEHGFLSPDWPILKRVRGLPGDKICRIETDISINGRHAATALAMDSLGRELPEWQGCVVVKFDEIFLLNAHRRSLDGRYFGVTHVSDVDGTAHLVWEMKR